MPEKLEALLNDVKGIGYTSVAALHNGTWSCSIIVSEHGEGHHYYGSGATIREAIEITVAAAKAAQHD